jgi:hypothetical protein
MKATLGIALLAVVLMAGVFPAVARGAGNPDPLGIRLVQQLCTS